MGNFFSMREDGAGSTIHEISVCIEGPENRLVTVATNATNHLEITAWQYTPPTFSSDLGLKVIGSYVSELTAVGPICATQYEESGMVVVVASTMNQLLTLSRFSVTSSGVTPLGDSSTLFDKHHIFQVSDILMIDSRFVICALDMSQRLTVFTVEFAIFTNTWSIISENIRGVSHVPPKATIAPNNQVIVAVRQDDKTIAVLCYQIADTGKIVFRSKAVGDTVDLIQVAIANVIFDNHQVITAATLNGVLQLQGWRVDDNGTVTVTGRATAGPERKVAIASMKDKEMLTVGFGSGNDLVFTAWQVNQGSLGDLTILRESPVSLNWPHPMSGRILALAPAFTLPGPDKGAFGPISVSMAAVSDEQLNLRLISLRAAPTTVLGA